MTTPIVSTAQLTPDGIWGYRKAIGTFVTALVALVANAWADGTITSAEWRTIVVGAVPAALAAFALANAVVPTPPAPVKPIDGEGDLGAVPPGYLPPG